ncbi:hypothetical protein [Komagataeibacter sp. FNDCR2]|uniref:hypothetical protein n=1 Tax=Komagataeibacter sp. FNDCR2 TaxID=2878682 RepID=UPI001E3F0A1D|nr:hypothetical protein [Komagataeibacter sp. FNDCR2]MCE2574463.1 hypothetical protein [Komagataeibacter sp. FNDCR2]
MNIFNIYKPTQIIKDETSPDFERAKEQEKNLWETKSICIPPKDINQNKVYISSKSLQVVIIKDGDEIIHSDTYCMDKKGSKLGKLMHGCPKIAKTIMDPTRKYTVEFRKPETKDITTWLESNFSPERKALGAVFRDVYDYLEASKAEIIRISKSVSEDLQTTKTVFKKVQESEKQASLDRQAASNEKKIGVLIGISGFLLGSLMDFGLLKDLDIFSITKTEAEIGLTSAIIILIVSGFLMMFRKK